MLLLAIFRLQQVLCKTCKEANSGGRQVLRKTCKEVNSGGRHPMTVSFLLLLLKGKSKLKTEHWCPAGHHSSRGI
jgi:hypothetical protein